MESRLPGEVVQQLLADVGDQVNIASRIHFHGMRILPCFQEANCGLSSLISCLATTWGIQ
jgi:hypothetical protein